MTVSLPQEKLNKLVERALATLHHTKRSIREVAEVIELIVSSFPAIKLARLHYLHLEFSKVNLTVFFSVFNDSGVFFTLFCNFKAHLHDIHFGHGTPKFWHAGQ